MANAVRISSWRPFFFTAGVFNAAVGVTLLAAPAAFYAMTALGEPEQFLEARIIGWMILLFGATYVLIGRAPDTPSSLIVLMGAGKLGVVALIVVYWLDGAINDLGALLGAVDLAWALGFLFMLLVRK